MIPLKKLLEISEFAIMNNFKVEIINESKALFAAKRVKVEYNDEDVNITIYDCEQVSVSFFELDVAKFELAAKLARMIHDNQEMGD